MLMIRLQRVGRKNDPSFRVVVTDSHNAAKKSGRFLRVLGNYDPRRDHSQVDAAAITDLIKKGAQVSPTVHNLLINLKIIEGKKKNVLPKKTVEKKEEPLPTEAPTPESPSAEAEASPEISAETPAEKVAEIEPTADAPAEPVATE